MILDYYDNDLYTKPVWLGNTIFHEPLTFICDNDGLPSANLMFEPRKIISFRLSTLDIEYTEGRDYTVNGRTVTLTENTRIPFLKQEDLYTTENKQFPAKDGIRFYKYLGNRFLITKQVAVTYIHNEKWDGFIPQYSGHLLPKTIEKIKKGESLKITFVGDSITANGDISGPMNVKPFMPKYTEMLIEKLRHTTKLQLKYDNFAIGGTATVHYFKNEELVKSSCASDPDLLVLAYGMNDGTEVEPDVFAKRLNEIYQRIKDANPDMECIQISTPLPSKLPCWENGLSVFNYHPFYEKEMLKYEKEGLAIARMTSLYEYVEGRKDYYSVTANGVNHPNDFIVRLYVQMIMTMLFEDYGQ